MRYCCIKQHDSSDCGIACLATVIRQYGSNISISRIREAAGTDIQGTSAYGMVKAARELGFSAKVYGSEDKEALLDEYPLPAIVLMNSNRGQMHYVVIHKINKKYVIYADPSVGIKKGDTREFLNKWAGLLLVLTPNSDFEEGENIGNPLSRFFKLLLPQKRILFNILFVSLCITIFGVLTSYYYVWIMDDIVPNNLRSTLITASVATILLYIFKIGFEFIRSYLAILLGQKLDISLMLGYYNHVIGLPMNFFGSYNIGEIIARFNDISSIRDIISNTMLSLLIDSVMVFGGGILLYCNNSKLFLITVVIIILHLIVVLAFKKKIRIYNKQQIEKNAILTSNLVESINGIETIKANNAEDNIKNKTEGVFVQYMKAMYNNGLIQSLQMMITNIIAAVGGAVILWVGTYNVLNGTMTIGELITFSSLVGYFLGPIKNIVNLQPKIENAVIAAERLCDILDLTLERTDEEVKKISIDNLKQDIVFNNVSFRYGTRQKILHNINLVIPKNSCVAIVGKSGSGKSTLAKVLMKYYEVEAGNIIVGNYNMKDISIDSVRNKMAYISQNNFLFSGTIRENLELGNANIRYEDIIEVCKMSKADEFIEKMPLRYDSVIEENGNNLSGGQKQRLVIARALLKNPDVLILDEATSHLDSIAEKAIDHTIKGLSYDITRVIIAHRLSTIVDCDIIYVMDEGRIVEAGNHMQLLNYRGLYYEMWTKQNYE